MPAEVSGYIESVDNDAILRLARGGRTIVRMEHGIGAFVVQDAALASLALTYPPDQEMIDALNGTYILVAIARLIRTPLSVSGRSSIWP